MDRIPDPYRELGVLRGATDGQIKAAHRRLAKRFHPDAPEGDTERFLAIQEAYLLLADPLRRREWDAAHASGPVHAGEAGGPRAGGTGGPLRARPAGSRSAAGGAAGARGAGAGAGRASGAGAGGAGGRKRGAASGRDHERAGAAWSASDREPDSRSTTWSAAGVPWWEDFTPRDASAGSAPGAAGAGSAGAAAGAGAAGPAKGPPPASTARAGTGRQGASTGRPGGGTGTRGAATAPRGPDDPDVYSRSSGAAWSMAARRYFRKGEADLPTGGSWTYRGTQVVTGAEARKVAAEQVAERRLAADELLRSRAPGPSTAPRQALSHEPRPAPSRPRAETAPKPAPPSTERARTATPAEASLLRRVRKALGLG